MLKIDEYSPWIARELDKTLRPTRSKASKLVDETARALDEGRGFYDGLARKGERDMASKKDAASDRAARVIGHEGQHAAASLRDIQIAEEDGWQSLKVLNGGVACACRSFRCRGECACSQSAGFSHLDQRS